MTNHTGKIAAAILVAALAGLVAGGGCTNTGDATKPQNDIYAAEASFTAAANAGIQYVTMPLCGPTHPKPACSDAAISARIKVAAQQAHEAVRAAQSGRGTVETANAAIATLVAITPRPGA